MRLFAAALLVLAVLGSAAVAQADEKLYLYTENFPPYNMSSTGNAFEHDGDNVEGVCADTVKAMLARTNLDYVIKLRNWDYGYGRALERANHGIFCTTYTEQRAPLFKWVGPLATHQWTIFGPPGSDLEIGALEDIGEMTVGSYRNDVRAQYLKERGFNVIEFDRDDLNPKRLALGQIDLWIADRQAGPYFAAQQGVEGLVPLYSFNDSELYLAINPQTSDEVVDQLNEALEAVKASGLLETLVDKYGL
ncbi:substrate-binding periplasmic protein [Marinobacter zhejiangensis]|uniref:Amino acid ABC transporter substrate-binding protein, PAAT family n=1 Tax=Marinobacter zhejiangensis TaxID=488535 RepID=A0A1I4LS88_9GAMM|nr:transporter substrate-binding domain-containing protein [Marinobacter zhejiangensis]SFL93447.1 amino acid ABC transporter substrate-binding protein, PAAT family [Marinobacter zhejiangensis]